MIEKVARFILRDVLDVKESEVWELRVENARLKSDNSHLRKVRKNLTEELGKLKELIEKVKRSYKIDE